MAGSLEPARGTGQLPSVFLPFQDFGGKGGMPFRIIENKTCRCYNKSQIILLDFKVNCRIRLKETGSAANVQ